MGLGVLENCSASCGAVPSPHPGLRSVCSQGRHLKLSLDVSKVEYDEGNRGILIVVVESYVSIMRNRTETVVEFRSHLRSFHVEG